MVKRVLVVLGAIGFLLFLCFPALWTLGAHLLSATLASDAVPARIEAPLPPRAGDSAAADLLAIAADLDWDDAGDCPRDALEKDELDRCVAIVSGQREVLARLLAWAEQPGELGPRQSAELGAHSRWPLPKGVSAQLPAVLPAMRLGRLAGIAAGVAHAGGDDGESERLLRALFDLARFFEQNPATLLQEMAGVSLTNHAVEVAVAVVTPAQAARVAAWLPTDADRLTSLRLAMGSEWAMMAYFLDYELEASPGPFSLVDELGADQEPLDEGEAVRIDWSAAKTLGLYDPAHTRRMHDRYWAALQASVREPPLLGRVVEVERWETMGWVKYFHNPIGRLLTSIAVPSFFHFGARVGSSIDRIGALRVVLAARQHVHERGAWPEKEGDLVPAYLPAWPKSALSLAPLPWDPASGTVFLFAEEDGTTVCREPDCAFTAKRE